MRLKKSIEKRVAPFLFRILAKKTIINFQKAIPEGIRIWPAFGTLLGLYRNGSLIKHDLDIDFCMFDSDYNDAIRDNLESNGFKLVREIISNKKTTELTFSKNKVNIDIFLVFEESNLFRTFDAGAENGEERRQFRALYGEDKAPTNVNNNSKYYLIQHNYGWLETLIPDNIEQHLEELYGKKYNTPDPNWDIASRPCRERLNHISTIKKYI
ncbi:LicD family protein [Endozoicomonas arenosclerae]|uniref:LicD family protein n=1 Tax=Endozoicomonas arenosclerae TaxID=1633495 RepID=UPI00078666F1|nr:LicD family protein [Endozoicomonas arenosclerae]